MDSITFHKHEGIGQICIAHPPVNALSADVVAGLAQGLDQFEADASLRALVIHCAGSTFVVGGDITAFADPGFSTAPFNQLLARIEGQQRPVVASLHGTALGGGLELALACHFRVAHSATRLGLPEIRLGLLPGSLGTQRLPRLVGPALALDMMRSGRMVGAQEAQVAGLVDALSDAAPLASGVAYVHALLLTATPIRRLSQTQVVPGDYQELLAAAQAAADKKSAYPAEAAVVRCVRSAIEDDFVTGARVEAEAFDALRGSPTSQALRHLFFAQRQAAKVPGLDAQSGRLPIESVGVLGAGTMGTGIAMCFLNAGIRTVLIDSAQAGLDRGLQMVRTTLEANVAKGRLTPQQLEARLGLLHGALDDQALAECDLVIEAVFEDMDLKRRVCERLGQICKPGAIIATNTSTLDVNVLAQASGRAADVVGMHFFSPAHIMQLLEVVRGEKTSPAVLTTVLALAKKIGKVAVVSGVCYGFIGNRMAEVYMREAEFLLMEGASPEQVDGAVQALGLAMGPCRMLDMAGIDVGAKTVIEYGKAGGLPPDASYRAVVRKMFELGRFGQKTGVGYYAYDGRKALPDAQTARIAAELAQAHGIAQRTNISDQEISERLLYPLINEGARIVEEGIAYRTSDIDVVWTAGYGFPDFQGGPMFMAQSIGLERIVERLDHYAQTRGNSYGYWTVSPLLRRLAQERQRFAA